MKKFLLWMLSTLAIYILVATMIMFSRETTLEGARAFDFDIFYKTAQTLNNYDVPSESFKSISDLLTIKNGQTILFPVAILSKNNCIENGDRNDSICSRFANLNEFKSAVLDIAPMDYYGKSIFNIDFEEGYIYKDIDETSALVGKTGKYLSKNKYFLLENIELLGVFFKNEWKGYFLNLSEPGRYENTIKKTWEKTSGVFVLLFGISILLFLLFSWYNRKKDREYIKLKNELNNKANFLHDLNNEFNNLRAEKNEIERKILEMMEKESEEDTTRIKDFQKRENELQNLIEKKRMEIIAAEHDENKLYMEIGKKSTSMTQDGMIKEIEFLFDQLQDVRKLWHREYPWISRRDLESAVTGYDSKIPFTVSQAFILFEKDVIVKQAKKYVDDIEKLDLIEKIDLISKNQNLKEDIVKKLHDIRKARNSWFHYGKLPNDKIIDDLLQVLDAYKVEPDFF